MNNKNNDAEYRIQQIASAWNSMPMDVRDLMSSRQSKMKSKTLPENELRAHRTLLHIVSRYDGKDGAIIECTIPAWDHHKTVCFLASDAGYLSEKLQPDTYVFAYVNIGANDEVDLFFRDFEEAPIPADSDDLLG